MEPTQVRWFKATLFVSSLVFLAFLLMAAFEENFTAEWREHQTQYGRRLADDARRAGRAATEYPLEVRQVYLEGLKRVDRCVSCHVGIDNPNFQDAPAPLRSHPGKLLADHPADKFGCTVCHQGQGRAISRDAAHGDVPFWTEPLLRGDMVYTSCGRCHYENDLYGGQSDLYGQVKPIETISQGELTGALPGAERARRGKKLVVANGCLGCHKYRGRGGTLGPDITYVGEKKEHDYDFKFVHGERSVENWLFQHFKSPSAVVPNTLMPDLKLEDDAARDLAAYMISLKRKSAPAAYTPLPRPVDPTPIRGETLYVAYCSGCHGVDGVGAIVRDALADKLPDRPRQLLTPSLRNVDTLSVSSDAFLRRIIQQGRQGTSMAAWSGDGGLSPDEIELIIGHIRNWEPRAADQDVVSASQGNARYGGALFRANCGGCHGPNGEGGRIGISLNAPSFLAVASDEMLARTILDGRPNTAMPAWRQFDNREVSDLLAWLRSWQPVQSKREEILARAGTQTNSVGAALYRSRCTVCHGERGEGKIGPSLNNPSVLPIVSNEFLADTIVRGRPGTAMPAWHSLSSDDVADLITLLRGWQQQPPRELARANLQGDWQHGEMLFEGMCASCHGPHGVGALGPQLVNPVFLDTVSDAQLVHWISYGRQGTQMRPFLRGQQGAADLGAAQIADIIAYLRYQRGRPNADGERIGLGFAPRGERLYRAMCLSCHGEHGEGTVGPGIRNPAFLASVSDGFLRATVVLGREKTEMRAMAQHGSGIVELRADEIDDLIAYLRGFEDRTEIPHRFVMGADPNRGQGLYAANCGGCHGPDGKGGFAPELNNAGFLRAATDGYLQATLIRGRRGTAMRSFALTGHGLANLNQDEINDIVAHIRQWSPDTRPLRRTEQFPNLRPVSLEPITH